MKTQNQTIIRGLIVLFIFVILIFTSFGEELQKKTDDVIYFRMRQLLGQEPALAQNLHVFTYDDRTSRPLGNSKMSPDMSVDLINYLASLKPRAIVLDKVFGMTDDVFDASKLSQEAKRLLFSAAYLQVDIDRSSPYRMGDSGGVHLTSDRSNDSDSLMKEITLDKDNVVYAFTSAMREANLKPRLAEYSEDRWESLALVHDSGLVLPHLGLSLVKSFELDNGKIFSENKQYIPTSPDGYLSPNFISLSAFAKQSYSIGYVLSHKDQMAKSFRPDDVFLVSYNFYTGTNDNVSTPIGILHGSYVIASILNSSITGNWISRLYVLPFLLLISILMALAFGYSVDRRGISLWASLIYLTLFLALGVLLFCAKGFILPYSAPAVSFVIVFATMRARATEILRERSVQEGLLRVKEEARALAAEKDAKQAAERIEAGRQAQLLLLPEGNGQKPVQLGSGTSAQASRAHKGSLTINGYRIEYIHQSYEEMSGDWLGIWEGHGPKAVFIGDVCGKGAGAAISHAYVAGLIRACEGNNVPLSEVFGLVEGFMWKTYDGQSNTTLAALELDDGGKVRVYNRGAGYVWLMTEKARGQDASFKGGVPVALVGGLSPVPKKDYELKIGEALFMFTDGYLEHRGYLRLKKALESLESFDFAVIEETVEGIGKQTEGFASGARLKDDKTILYIERIS